MRTWIDAAVLAKTKHVQGGFVVRATAGLPFVLSEGMEAAFVPPVLDAPRRARVEAVAASGAHAAVVSFDVVRDIDTAEKLVGCHCLVRRADLSADILDTHEDDWRGWRVYDMRAGFVGTVSGIAHLPGQTMMEIQATGQARTILVPLVDEFVVDVDEDAHLIDINVPSGLLDL